MHEHPALALREKKDASILVATDLVRRGEADAVVTAGHTGPEWPPRSCGSADCRASTGPHWRSDDHEIGAVRLPRHRCDPRLSGENLYQYAEMGPCSPSGSSAWNGPGCVAVDRRGAARATPGSASPPSCSISPT
jgi:hypothetical protein